MPTTTVKTIYGRFEDSKEAQLLKLSGLEFINTRDGLFTVQYETGDKLLLAEYDTFTSGMNLFYGETNHLDLTDFDTSNITDMSYMFAEFEGDEYLDLRHFDTSKVTSMCGMFLKSKIKGFISDEHDNIQESLINQYYDYVSKLNDFTIGNKSKYEQSLDQCDPTKLSLPSFNTSNVLQAQRMFANCTNLICLNLNNFTFDNLMYANSMFEKCKNLVTVSLHNIKSKWLCNVNSMFASCSAIMFIDCANLQGTEQKHHDFECNKMFQDCTRVRVINLAYVNLDSSELAEYTVPTEVFKDIGYANINHKIGVLVITDDKLIKSCLEKAQGDTDNKLISNVHVVSYSEFNNKSIKLNKDMFILRPPCVN